MVTDDSPKQKITERAKGVINAMDDYQRPCQATYEAVVTYDPATKKIEVVSLDIGDLYRK